MLHVAVQSSDLASVGYDPTTRTLEILFRSGGLYEYYSVPEAVHAALLAAPSKGRFFHARIKGVYAYRRVR